MNLSRRDFLLASIACIFVLPQVLYSKSASKTTSITKSRSKVLLRLAKCIAEVETGQNDDAVGRAGERSKYQISRIVWEQHFPGRAFIECYGINADECAIKHLSWLKQNLPRNNHFWVVYAWNAGLTNTRIAMSKAITYPPSYEFAEHVENLYNDRNFK